MDEGNWHLSVFDCDFMDLHNLLNDSVSEHLHRYLSNHLSRNSSLSLNNFRDFFLDNYLNSSISFGNLYLFDNLNLRLININLFDNFYLSDNWNLSNNLDYLQVRHFNSDYFFNESWHLDNFLYYPWYGHYLLYYSLNFNNSWNFHNFLYNLFNNNSFDLYYLSLGDYRNRNLNTHLLDYFLA